MDQERQRLIVDLLRDLNLRVTALEVEVGADFGKLARKMLEDLDKPEPARPWCALCGRVVPEGFFHHPADLKSRHKGICCLEAPLAHTVRPIRHISEDTRKLAPADGQVASGGNKE